MNGFLDFINIRLYELSDSRIETDMYNIRMFGIFVWLDISLDFFYQYKLLILFLDDTYGYAVSREMQYAWNLSFYSIFYAFVVWTLLKKYPVLGWSAARSFDPESTDSRDNLRVNSNVRTSLQSCAKVERLINVNQNEKTKWKYGQQIERGKLDGRTCREKRDSDDKQAYISLFS